MKNRLLLQNGILLLFIFFAYSSGLPTLSTGKVVLIQAQANNNYISIDASSKQLSVNNSTSQEYFRVIVNADGTYSFQSGSNNCYITADYSLSPATLVTNRTSIDIWEKFKIIPQGGNSFSLQSYNGTYVCADISLPNLPVTANRTTIGSWEKLNMVVPFGVCAITMAHYNGGMVEDITDYDVHADGTFFINAMNSACISTLGVSSYSTSHIKDYDNTPQFWTTAPTNNYEFLFYAGHGDVGFFPVWNSFFNGGWEDKVYFSSTYYTYASSPTPNLICSYFGGRTKWVMLMGCKMLGDSLNFPPTTDFMPSFQGVHAMVGYGSLSTFFTSHCKYQSFWDFITFQPCTVYYRSTQDQYNQFIKSWMLSGSGNQSFWDAWNTSVNLVYTSNLPNSQNQGGNFPTIGYPGIEATGIGVAGVINTNGTPQDYKGLNDKILSAPNIPTPMYNTPYWVPGGKIMKDPIFGNPIVLPIGPKLERRDVIYNSPTYRTM